MSHHSKSVDLRGENGGSRILIRILCSIVIKYHLYHLHLYLCTFTIFHTLQSPPPLPFYGRKKKNSELCRDTPHSRFKIIKKIEKNLPFMFPKNFFSLPKKKRKKKIMWSNSTLLHYLFSTIDPLHCWVIENENCCLPLPSVVSSFILFSFIYSPSPLHRLANWRDGRSDGISFF